MRALSYGSCTSHTLRFAAGALDVLRKPRGLHEAKARDAFCAALRGLGVEVATGVFGARMTVELVNDPDPILCKLDRVATADGMILDNCGRWANLVAWTLPRVAPKAWLVSFA